MNAATLYAQISREILLLNDESSDESLSEFMRNDKGFLKLRNQLLCRSCRELCLEPYSSEFCQHLTCEKCLENKQIRNYGCKWCRVIENLKHDINSKILVSLYKNLCAILREFLTGSTNDAGLSSTKSKLLRFLDEGCSSNHSTTDKQQKSEAKKTEPKETVVDVDNVVQKDCAPCCCTCVQKGARKSSETNISDDPIEVKAAQSSGISADKEPITNNRELLFDDVSSTVPDSVPVVYSVPNDPVRENQNKDGRQCNHLSETSRTSTLINKQDDSAVSFKDSVSNTNQESSNNISPTKFYKTMSSISVKGKGDSNIFEKFGLALSPPDVSKDYKPKNPTLTKANNINKKPGKKMNESLLINNETCTKEPKLKPLKLKVRKIPSNSNIANYQVQYNISSISDDPVSGEIVPLKTNPLIDKQSSDTNLNQRKNKRKATFISNYAVFSDDDSDFEPLFYTGKKKVVKSSKKLKTPKESREICGCGAGSHVKYFTDICKRSRCPCYSQGRACVNCKCRFCSNPFLLDDEIEEIDSDSDSDSSLDQPSKSNFIPSEVEVVDVEA